MDAYRRLRNGERVTLMIPNTDRSGSREIRKFNGNTFEISNSRQLKFGYIYELKGVVSKMGVPFSFVRDWLMPLEEE